MPSRNQTQRVDALFASVTDAMVDGEALNVQDNSLRVERLLLEMVRPDPVQPRRVLPEALHVAFHTHRLTPTQALKELVQLVQVAARQRGRPFNHVLELMVNTNDEREEDTEPKLSPEEKLLGDLVNLAVTIRDDGQVNPLTVVDVSQGVSHLFRIETGERRYWATWLLREFLPGYEGDGMIPCTIVPAKQSSVFRQAKENTARSGLSAIAMARQAALLLLTVHGYEMPNEAVTNDFYRQALELDLKSKREYTELVLSAMGGIGKMHFSRYKALLKLSDEAIELADRFNMDERKLRPVVALSQELHTEIVRQMIDFNLNAKQVEELCAGDVDTQDDADGLPAPAMKIAKATHSTTHATPQDIARALLRQEGDVTLAKARLQALRKLLAEVEVYLQE